MARTLGTPLRRRGPDGEGAWADAAAGIGLAHRRLAVVDLSDAGSQPMISASGRHVITYNGEIYNHQDLRDELEGLGVRFRGHSDTEVLLAAIGQWGLDGTLDRSDGMFAFGLWDRLERTLVLVRDRLGEKPLYYGRLRSGDVVFGSSLDVFRSHPEFDAELDTDALALYFRHKYVPAPYSIYVGVSKLPPGCAVAVAGDGTIGEPVPYWSYFDVVERGATFDGGDDDAVERLDELLRRSVRRRCFADVPVGAFLSGGIDSSTIVAVAQQELARPIRTFTIGSPNADYDESDPARAVAAYLGTSHTGRLLTSDEALGAVHELGAVYDEPFGDSSQIASLLVSRLARTEVTVALTGDGGDEFFGGYNRYLSTPALWAAAERVPRALRRGAVASLDRVAPEVWDRAARAVPSRLRPQQVGLKVQKALRVGGARSPHDAFIQLITDWPDPTRLVPGSREPRTVLTDPLRHPVTPTFVESMMALDSVTYLPDDILAKVDRAGMATSLETRLPLLDRDIVEFAASLPMHMRIRRTSSKWVLRAVLERYVPTDLVDRPKSGFGIPIDEWLRGPLRTWADDLLHSEPVRRYLDIGQIEPVWRSHLSGQRNAAYELWDVLMFAAWAIHRP